MPARGKRRLRNGGLARAATARRPRAVPRHDAFRNLAASAPDIIARRLEEILESIQDGFFTVDRDWNFTYINERAAGNLGLAPRDLLGANLWEKFPGIAGTAHEGAYRRAMEGREIRKFEMQGVLTDRWYSITAYPSEEGISVFWQDISERKRAEKELLQLNRRLQALMEAVPVGVSFSEDATCRHIAGNAVFNEQFEPPPLDNVSASAGDEGAYGRRIRYFRGGRELSADELPLQRAVAENRLVPPMEIEIDMPNGRRWVAEASAAPVRDENGRVAAGIAVTADITLRKRIEKALRTANERLREADRRKDEFLAVLSHELRGPLAPIRNGITILREAVPGSEQAVRALDILDSQTAQLTGLVDDLLDLNRISRGRIELHRRRCDFADLVRRTVEDHRADFDSKSIRLAVEAGAGPLWIEADPTRIGQIVGNLLGNAWKFTPPGGIVDVCASAENNRAVLRIRDTGAGISPGLLAEIFDPFTQAEQTLARSQGGLGLGLPLVKQFVKIHGGTVSAASEGEGRGAEFTVRLPLMADTGFRKHAPPAVRPPGKLRILVIEDYADAAESLRTVLEILGHEARVAVDGASGLAAVRETPPDLVLCDIGLPDMNGYAVAREIRQDAGLSGIRLVALTGYAQPEDAAKSVEAGFDLHVAKPLGVGQLRDLLASISAHAAERRKSGR